MAACQNYGLFLGASKVKYSVPYYSREHGSREGGPLEDDYPPSRALYELPC